MKKHLYISANYDFNQICPGLNETILAKRSLDKHPFSDSAETSQVVDHLIHAHDLRGCKLSVTPRYKDTQRGPTRLVSPQFASRVSVTSSSTPTRGGTFTIPKNRDSGSDFLIHNSSGRINLDSRFLILTNRATSNADPEQLLAKVIGHSCFLGSLLFQ